LSGIAPDLPVEPPTTIELVAGVDEGPEAEVLVAIVLDIDEGTVTFGTTNAFTYEISKYALDNPEPSVLMTLL